MQSVSGLDSGRKCSGYHVEDADDVMGDANDSVYEFEHHHANSAEKRGIEDNAGSQVIHDESDTSEPLKKKTVPPNGKKTKGRVKIKMEFIDNKLRRYTTFSKRKTGIMKKAYELSTLTGTQVMLLVASETGHVYTFATRKLQPMITSDSGKALIQTCLNSPDPPVGPGSSGDQRMSATGFEETELTYSVGDDQENKQKDLSPRLLHGCPPSASPDSVSSSGSASPVSISQNNASTISPTVVNASSSIPISSFSFLPQPNTVTTSSASSTSVNGNSENQSTSGTTISMQLPQTAGFATILTPTATLSPGTPVHIGALQAAAAAAAHIHSSVQHSNSQNQSQTAVYRLPQAAPLVTIPGNSGQQSTNGASSSQGPSTVTVAPTTQQSLSVVSGNVMIPAHPSIPSSSASVPVPAGTVMYQTPQGVVYATQSSTLPEGVILNLGQTHTLSLQQEHGNGTQQYITIPVPVSLTAAQQQSLMASLSQSSSGRVEGNVGIASSTTSSSSSSSSAGGSDGFLVKKERSRRQNCISHNT